MPEARPPLAPALSLLVSGALFVPLGTAMSRSGLPIPLAAVILAPLPWVLGLVTGPGAWRLRFAASLLYTGVFLLGWALASDSVSLPPAVLLGAVLGTVVAAYETAWELASRPRRESLGAFAWLAVGAACGLAIAIFSGPRGGASHTVAWLRDLFGLSEVDAVTLAIRIRKTLHFLFYGFLAFSAARAARCVGARPGRAVLFGLSVAFLHGAFDEGYQSLVPGRTGTAADVLLNMSGAMAFTVPLLFRRTGEARTGKAGPAAPSTPPPAYRSRSGRGGSPSPDAASRPPD